MLDPDDRHKGGRWPKTLAKQPEGGHRPDGQARCGRPDHRTQAPVPDVTGTAPICLQTSEFGRGTGDPERARRDHYPDGSDAANPRLSAAPVIVGPGSSSRAIAHRKPAETPPASPAAPTALAHGPAFVRFRAPRSL